MFKPLIYETAKMKHSCVAEKHVLGWSLIYIKTNYSKHFLPCNHVPKDIYHVVWKTPPEKLQFVSLATPVIGLHSVSHLNIHPNNTFSSLPASKSRRQHRPGKFGYFRSGTSSSDVASNWRSIFIFLGNRFDGRWISRQYWKVESVSLVF